MEASILEQLFEKHYNDALLYTLSLCGDRQIAEDIVSESFCKALCASDINIRSFRSWLLTVCRHEFVDFCRRRKRISFEELHEGYSAETEELLDRIIRAEEYRALYRAIGLLEKQRREAVLLFYFSGVTVREIAMILGTSEGNAKVLLHRARNELKHILEERT